MKKREKARRTHAAVRVFLPFFMLTFYYEKKFLNNVNNPQENPAGYLLGNINFSIPRKVSLGQLLISQAKY